MKPESIKEFFEDLKRTANQKSNRSKQYFISIHINLYKDIVIKRFQYSSHDRIPSIVNRDCLHIHSEEFNESTFIECKNIFYLNYNEIFIKSGDEI